MNRPVALVARCRSGLGGVRWFSDVVGGWLFAMAWFGTCACVAAQWLPGMAPDAKHTTDLADRRTGHESG
jgi:undecaprenyl-diphosphatase